MKACRWREALQETSDAGPSHNTNQQCIIRVDAIAYHAASTLSHVRMCTPLSSTPRHIVPSEEHSKTMPLRRLHHHGRLLRRERWVTGPGARGQGGAGRQRHAGAVRGGLGRRGGEARAGPPAAGLPHQGAVFTAEPQSLWQKVLPTGRTLGRTSSTLLTEPGKPAIGIALRPAILPGVAEHVREAGEDMTNGRTLLGRFCREHCQAGMLLHGDC